MLKIRYHHLMCLPRFCGEGYSSEFCKNMQAVKEKIKDGDFELCEECDSICKACPQNIGGVCADNERVSSYDSAVKSALQNNVQPLPCNICSDCRWYCICKNEK